MSPGADVLCVGGSPRAQGRREGLRLRDHYRADAKSPLGWWLGSGRVPRECRGFAHETPQAYERLAGFSAATRVPLPQAFASDCRALREASWGREGASLWIECRSPGRLRCLRPDAGFETLEWLESGRLSPSLSCNREGLVGLATTARPRDPEAAPSHWLLGDALLRFDRAEIAARWCARRRPSGEGQLVFLDPGGSCVITEIDDSGARVRNHEGSQPPPRNVVYAAADALRVAWEGRRQGFVLSQLSIGDASQSPTARAGSSVISK